MRGGAIAEEMSFVRPRLDGQTDGYGGGSDRGLGDARRMGRSAVVVDETGGDQWERELVNCYWHLAHMWGRTAETELNWFSRQAEG